MALSKPERNLFLCLPKEKFQIQPKPNQTPNYSLPLLAAAAIYLPKDNPKSPRGEDAHFICTTHNTIGVADGVGGWSKLGVDSGQYARDLMTNCAMETRRAPNGEINPKTVLSNAYYNTKVQGSSTACIVSLFTGYNSNKNILRLRAANVGDSGFLIVRDGKVIYQSPVQQRGFNFPYQLGKNRGDGPYVAASLEVPVKIGDVVVVGTDGLFDNLEISEIEERIKRDLENMSPEEMAYRIAILALFNSLDRYSETPFSRKAKEAGHQYMGGKIDDITVIVAQIQRCRVQF